MKIDVEKGLGQELLRARGVEKWPVWTHEPATFPWSYDECEHCYLLEGDVTVKTESGQEVRFGAGDYVVFPAGLSCTWTIHKAVRKHYRFQ